MSMFEMACWAVSVRSLSSSRFTDRCKSGECMNCMNSAGRHSGESTHHVWVDGTIKTLLH